MITKEMLIEKMKAYGLNRFSSASVIRVVEGDIVFGSSVKSRLEDDELDASELVFGFSRNINQAKVESLLPELNILLAGSSKEWVCTDIDTNQYRKTISPTRFLFKEDRVSDPLTGKTEVYEQEINLDEFTIADMIDYCSSFGYSESQVRAWYQSSSNLDLIAECIFEMMH